MAVLAAVQDVVPTWLDRTLYPFESRWIDIDGNRIHYVDEGKGPILLLLHGNGSWSFLYRHMIFRLAGQFSMHCARPCWLRPQPGPARLQLQAKGPLSGSRELCTRL